MGGRITGLVHDLGKYSGAFRAYLDSATGILDPDADDYVDAASLKGKIDHSTAGAQLIWSRLSATNSESRFTAQVLALCVASHHSGLIDCVSADPNSFGEATLLRRLHKSDDKTHLVEVLENADQRVVHEANKLLTDPNLAAEMMRAARQIAAANAKASCKVVGQHLGLLVRFLFSCLIDADRIDTSVFERSGPAKHNPPALPDWARLQAHLDRHLAEKPIVRPIDDLRRNISQHCLDSAADNHRIRTLTVPTGGGKTLAGLRFALEHARRRALERIIFIVPFTTIIDQNAKVTREILEPPGVPRGSVVLEHHSNLTPERQSWKEKILCENWDAPIIYTTMVQFLEALFGAGTRGARRMHQLTNSVLVFDEVQALPIACVHLFNNAINFLAEQGNSTMVLCTATQPLLHRVDSEKGLLRLQPGHEMMSDVKALFAQLKRVTLIDDRRPGGWTFSEASQLALAQVREHGSCLVVVNTKKAAKALYQLLRDESELTLFHLSTDMCPAHRRTVLDSVIASLAEKPTLCISTQLIEAGVDIDFGSVIRFMAGLDSIAQSAGRCNRNGSRPAGLVRVINVSEESLDGLPEIAKAAEVARRVLDDYRANPSRYADDPLGPEAMSDYYNYYFFERSAEMDYPLTAKGQSGKTKGTLVDLLSINSNAVEEYRRRHEANPDLNFHQAFMTAANAFRAIDAPTRGVVVPYARGREVISALCSCNEPQEQFRLLKEAQQYTVNVFPHTLERLQSSGAIFRAQDLDVLCLRESFYDPSFGLSLEPTSLMETLDA